MAGVPGNVPQPQPRYGDGVARERALNAVPAGPSPTDMPPGGLMRPTERPDEPITAGLPIGPGPGPEAIAPAGIQPGSRMDLVLRIRAIAARYPNPNLMALLRDMEAGDRRPQRMDGGPTPIDLTVKQAGRRTMSTRRLGKTEPAPPESVKAAGRDILRTETPWPEDPTTRGAG